MPATNSPFGGDIAASRNEPQRCGTGSNIIGARSGSAPRSCCCSCCAPSFGARRHGRGPQRSDPCSVGRRQPPRHHHVAIGLAKHRRSPALTSATTGRICKPDRRTTSGVTRAGPSNRVGAGANIAGWLKWSSNDAGCARTGALNTPRRLHVAAFVGIGNQQLTVVDAVGTVWRLSNVPRPCSSVPMVTE